MSEWTSVKVSAWISVKDRLPVHNTEVLGALRGCESGKYILRAVELVPHQDHDWESEGFEIANCWDITHWMPLPAPPKESDYG